MSTPAARTTPDTPTAAEWSAAASYAVGDLVSPGWQPWYALHYIVKAA